MLETFTLQSPGAALASLWSRAPLELWSAGAELHDAPPSFAVAEGHLLLVRGRLRLDADTTLEGPALVLLDPSTSLQLEPLDAHTRVLLWSVQSPQTRAGSAGKPRILRGQELEEPRTVTTGATFVHWFPRLRSRVPQRTFAGTPTLLLNLGHAALPLVAAGALSALAGGTGAVADDVFSLTLPPGTGPLLAVERLEVTHDAARDTLGLGG